MAPYPLYPTSPASAMSAGAHRNADKDKDKGVNVQVLLRCRPFSEDELRSNAPQVITCNEARREVLANLNIANKQIDRAFTFDKVFGPQAKQKDLYDQAITPIVNEVLEGFNCTIFAYGQTGTGKTHTMEGSGKITKNGEMPAEAGVIPRAVQQIFETLESQKAEYSMKVTHLELYNEEITDLLAPPDDVLRSMADEKQRKPLALMEDGKGGVLVRGLEEEVVYTATDIYNLLERGSAKRRTAETLLNKQSSRSHSIFSITIHIKEATPEGEELIKCGKLNLVDLAGSENVTRSGAREGRAREAGEINKSLLTLGRVITALVEHLGHVPYRDSKLTRLLRDSLGGRTKTCIIATVSPSVHCLEETLSTLDYANRAKSIKNKPEVNQKMMKSALIKDLSTEIERLKTDLHAAREKNGVFLPRERYYQEEAEKKAMTERIEQMELELVTKDKQSEDLQRLLDSQSHINTKLTAELHVTQEKLDQTQESLSEVKEQIKQIQYTVKEKDFMIAKFQRSENMLIKKASSLQSHLENVASDNAGLFSKIERKDKVESENRSLIQSYHSALSTHLDLLSGIVTSSVKQQQQKLQDLEIQLQSFYSTKNKGTDELKTRLLDIKNLYCEGLTGLHELAKAHEKESSSVFQKLGSSFSAHVCAMKEHLSVSVHELETILKDLQASLSEQEEELASFILQQQQAANQSIDATQNISALIVEFFDSVERKSEESLHSCRQNQHDQRQCLSDFEKQYKESSKQEGDQLLENIGEMLAAMRARKVDFVQSKVQTLTNTIMENAENLEQSMGAMHSTTVKVKDQWQAYVKQAENSYDNCSTALIGRQCQLKELSQQGLNGMTKVEQDWKSIQSSLQQLESDNRLVVDAIIKEGVYNNGLLLSNFEQLDISIQTDMQSSINNFEESIDSALSIDKNMVESAFTATSHSSSGIEALQSRHDSGIKETKNESNHYLIEEFLEDKPTCLTPKLRLIDVPSKESIEALRAPSLEKLMEEFGEENSITISTVETKSIPAPRETKIPIFADSSLLRDNRAPLANVN